MSKDKLLGQLYEKLDKVKGYAYATSIMHWDSATGAPKSGGLKRADSIGILSEDIYKNIVSDEVIEIVKKLKEMESELTTVEKILVEDVQKNIDSYIKIPMEEYVKYSSLVAKATLVWEDAKEKNDFESYAPYLEEIIGYIRKFADYRGYTDHPYNVYLDDYEPGMTVEKLDEFFAELKEGIVPLVKKIADKNMDFNKDFISVPFAIEDQKALSEELVQYIGFDLSRGFLKESVHPFTMGLCKDDVRLTTHYHLSNPMSSYFSTAHEGGHAIYEQNFDDSISGAYLVDAASMGIHESQSRMYENYICRNYNYWKNNYNKLQDRFPDQLGKVDLDTFYKAINEAKCTLIRTESDELTYSLHIMIRYELEIELLNGTLEVKDLPKAWNQKMQSYLGIVPPNDSLGVLQDTHWSNGLFGYFPSYALGNAYAAQLYKQMDKDMDIEKVIEKDELPKIKEWLTDNVHKYGKLMKPEELIVKATGEKLNPKYYIEYLNDKYSKIYDL